MLKTTKMQEKDLIPHLTFLAFAKKHAKSQNVSLLDLFFLLLVADSPNRGCFFYCKILQVNYRDLWQHNIVRLMTKGFLLKEGRKYSCSSSGIAVVKSFFKAVPL
jgi:hypothetical protein